jgi:hypothetical protein
MVHAFTLPKFISMGGDGRLLTQPRDLALRVGGVGERLPHRGVAGGRAHAVGACAVDHERRDRLAEREPAATSLAVARPDRIAASRCSPAFE